MIISIIGTPAFDGVEQVNLLYNFLEALKSKIIFFAFLKQIPPWYYIFIIFIFFSKRRIEIIVFFIFNLIVFFSINKWLWTFAKYTLEYLVPFVILGHFIFFNYLIKKKNFLALNIVSVIIIIFNIYEVIKFPSSNLPFDEIQEKDFLSVNTNLDKNTKYVTNIPYRYDDAYEYISKINAKEQTLLIGTDYGFLPQIISNYTFNELVKIINLRSQYDRTIGNNQSSAIKINAIISKNYAEDNIISETVKKRSGITKNEVDQKIIVSQIDSNKIIQNINQIDNLNYLLLANETFKGSRKSLIKMFLDTNWLIEKKFIDKNYGTSLLLLKKVK